MSKSMASPSPEKSLIAIVTMAHCGFLKYILNKKNDIIRSIYNNTQTRRRDYFEAIGSLLKYERFFSEIVLLECLSRRIPRYLCANKTTHAVSRNTTKCKNKGIDEFINIYKLLKEKNISDEQKILKLTGRYLLVGDKFINYCIKTKADVVAKKDDDIWGEQGKGIHTFLFCARKKILVAFANYLLNNSKYKEFGSIPVEWIFYNYILECNVTIDYYHDDMEIIVRYATQ